MSPPQLIKLVIEQLQRRDEALTARELARRLLNERSVTDITLDALTERLSLALEVESQTRREVARLVRRGDRYTVIDTGVYSIVSSDTDSVQTRAAYAETSGKRGENRKNTITAQLTSTECAETEEGSGRQGEITLSLYLRDYPLIRRVTALLNLAHGERQSLIDALRRGVRRAVKHHGDSIDEFEGEAWIRAHLSGGSAALAKRLWEGSGHLLRPNDLENCWIFIERYGLMSCSEDRCCRVNERGMHLMSHEHEARGREDLQRLRRSNLLREIDEREGLHHLLLICLEHHKLGEDELSKLWGAELRRMGKRRSIEWLSRGMLTRLEHLSDRGLIRLEDQRWGLTEEGLSWLRFGGVKAPSADQEALEQVWGALSRQRELARESIASLLDSMDPRRFETLVCELLECMGYDEIHLTPSQNDMGIDVIANIELGITSVREVVQVKRQHRAIHRPVLDALRGSLHRFDAVRGTLITTSSFSKGTRAAAFERGAAPVTLIDGARLIDLLMAHELGVKPIPLKLWQVDPSKFERGSDRMWPIWNAKRVHDSELK